MSISEGCFHRFEGSVINSKASSSLSVSVACGLIGPRNSKIVHGVHLEIHSVLA